MVASEHHEDGDVVDQQEEGDEDVTWVSKRLPSRAKVDLKLNWRFKA